MSDTNKALYRTMIDEYLNKGDFAAVEKYVEPNFVDHRYPDHSGLEGAKRTITELRQAFPDIHFTAEDMIAEGDKVVARLRATGTHRGEFMGVPATGRRVTWTAINIARISGGKFVELWGEVDALGLLRALGAKV